MACWENQEVGEASAAGSIILPSVSVRVETVGTFVKSIVDPSKYVNLSDGSPLTIASPSESKLRGSLLDSSECVSIGVRIGGPLLDSSESVDVTGLNGKIMWVPSHRGCSRVSSFGDGLRGLSSRLYATLPPLLSGRTWMKCTQDAVGGCY